VTVSLSRAQLLSRGVKGGAALVLAGSVAGSFVGSASAAPIPDADLAYARLLVGAELLAADFYTQVIAAKQFGGVALKYLNRAFFNEQEHYHAVSGILTGAAQVPAAPADFDFSYPTGTFDSKGSIVKLGITLETAVLGAYLGAVDALQTNALKLPVARIAASEAEHLSVFTQLSGGNPVGVSFPNPLTIDEASDALDAYTS
jgi:Ferritin-like domain